MQIKTERTQISKILNRRLVFCKDFFSFHFQICTEEVSLLQSCNPIVGAGSDFILWKLLWKFSHVPLPKPKMDAAGLELSIARTSWGSQLCSGAVRGELGNGSMSGKLPGGFWKNQWRAWFEINHASVKGNCVITDWQGRRGGAAHRCRRQWQVLLFETTNDDTLCAQK